MYHLFSFSFFCIHKVVTKITIMMIYIMNDMPLKNYEQKNKYLLSDRFGRPKETELLLLFPIGHTPIEGTIINTVIEMAISQIA